MVPREAAAEERPKALGPRIRQRRRYADLSSDEEEEADEEEESGRPASARSLLHQRRFQESAYRVIALRRCGPPSAGSPQLSRRRLLEGFLELGAREQAFASSVLSSGALMLVSTRILLKCGRKLSKGAAMSDSNKDMVLGLLAQAVYQSKLSTARHCWSAHIQPALQKISDLRENFEQLKEQFKTARSDYLREISALRDQIRSREDPDSSMDQHRDIVSFYDPSLVLEPPELEFLSKAVSEKVKMIFEAKPGVQGCNLAQLEALLQRRESNEVRDLKAALKRSMAEADQLRSEVRELLAWQRGRRAAAAAAPEGGGSAAEEVEADHVEDPGGGEEAEEEEEDDDEEEEEPEPSIIDLVLQGRSDGGSKEASTSEEASLERWSDEHNTEYGDSEAANYYLLQRRFRRQQEACRVAHEAARHKETALVAARGRLDEMEGAFRQLRAQSSRQRHALKLAEPRCAQKAREGTEEANGALPRCASWPGGMEGSYCLANSSGPQLRRGRTFPVDTREIRSASRGPGESPRARARRRGLRPRLSSSDLDLELELEPAQNLFEALWAAWSPGAAKASQQTPLQLDPPVKFNLPAPKQPSTKEPVSPEEAEAHQEKLLMLLNNAEAQVWNLAERCQDLQAQKQTLSLEADELRRSLWSLRKGDVRRLAEDALFETEHFRKLEALLERSPRQASVSAERLRSKLADAQTCHEDACTKLHSELEDGHELTAVDPAWLERVEAARAEVIRSQRNLRHAEMKFAVAKCEEAVSTANACQEAVGADAEQPRCPGCGELEKVRALLSTVNCHSKDLCSKFQDSAAENVQLIEAFDELQTEVAGSMAVLKESSVFDADPELRAVLVSLEEAGRQTVHDRLFGSGRWLSERFAEKRKRYCQESKSALLLCLKLGAGAAAAPSAEPEEPPEQAAVAPADAGPDAGAGAAEEPSEERPPPPRPPAAAKTARRLRAVAKAALAAARKGDKASSQLAAPASEAAASEEAVAEATLPAEAAAGATPALDSTETASATAGAAPEAEANVHKPSEAAELLLNGSKEASKEPSATGQRRLQRPAAARPPTPRAAPGERPPPGGPAQEQGGGATAAPGAPPPRTAAPVPAPPAPLGGRPRGRQGSPPQGLPSVPAPKQARRNMALAHTLAFDPVQMLNMAQQAGSAGPLPPTSARTPSPPVTHRRTYPSRDSVISPGRPPASLPVLVRGVAHLPPAANRGRAAGQRGVVSGSQEMMLGATIQ